jgi:two-component system chemotaxis response regulator CheY
VKRIIIADDSATARMFIRRCLVIIGFEDGAIVEAPDGKEALERVKEEPTDLLVTDLNMPVMDGQSLLRRMKANPKLNGIPVLVITSAGNPAKEAELMELGALAVLNKPVSPANLMDVLGPLLS